MAGEQSAELDAEVGGQKLKYSGPINTLFTVLGFVLTALIAYVMYTHAGDAKADARALVDALREQTQVLRESNCLNTYRGPEEQRAAFCKAVVR